MAQVSLNERQRRILIQYLIRYGRIDTVQQRLNFYENSGIESIAPDIPQAISIEGSTDEFCRALLRLLLKRETVAGATTSPLVAVLSYLRDIAAGNEDVRTFVDEILSSYLPPSPARATPSFSFSWLPLPFPLLLILAGCILLFLVVNLSRWAQPSEPIATSEPMQGIADRSTSTPSRSPLPTTRAASPTVSPTIRVIIPPRDQQITPTPKPTRPLEGPIPQRLLIPSIGVSAAIEQVGLSVEGAVDVPKDVDNVSWWQDSAIPGERGNSIIVGFVDDWRFQPAVFWDLRLLTLGDQVIIVDFEGKRKVFEVVEVAVYQWDDYSVLDKIYGATEYRNLNLITSVGTWDDTLDDYDQRLVVYTRYID